MRNSSTNGFTLVELMITVVVLGILAAIAYPSYTRFITETRRSDATIGLSRLAALQERFLTNCGRYAASFGTAQACGTAAAPEDATMIASSTTPDGYYTIAIATNATGSSYTLTATPVGTQLANDGGTGGKCVTIILSSTGQKSATGTESANCWKK
jgi:type IV pilus assembly protein PilE